MQYKDTSKEVREVIPVSQTTLKKLIREGKFTKPQLVGGSHYWDEKDKYDFLSAQVGYEVKAGDVAFASCMAYEYLGRSNTWFWQAEKDGLISSFKIFSRRYYLKSVLDAYVSGESESKEVA